jgi:hypothetical protein
MIQTHRMPPITFEEIAHWFLRLNGCLTIPNFVIHPERGGGQKTDVDVIAVRFPFRSENRELPMVDHSVMTADPDRIRVFLTEAKEGVCGLNEPWTDERRHNVQRMLLAVGTFPADAVDDVATTLYAEGAYRDDRYSVSFLCLGRKRNEQIADRYPNVPQVTRDEVTGFIFDRFRQYARQKSDKQQWDQTGKFLYSAAMQSHDVVAFRECLFRPDIRLANRPL